MTRTSAMKVAESTLAYAISPRRVKDLPEHERPRELFERDGPEALSDRCLIALILRSGVRGRSVVEVADDLLAEYGSITALAQVSAEDLASRPGVGRVRAQVLKSALELARRLGREDLPAQPIVRTPEDAARLVRHDARMREGEAFWVILLDAKYRLRRRPYQVSAGILDACQVHPREVFKEAIRACSAALVLVHNHPSGDPTPSAEDLHITRQLVEAGRIMGIEVLDHVILGQRAPARPLDYLSLRESGLITFG